jgi:hypothetical protein
VNFETTVAANRDFFESMSERHSLSSNFTRSLIIHFVLVYWLLVVSRTQVTHSTLVESISSMSTCLHSLNSDWGLSIQWRIESITSIMMLYVVLFYISISNHILIAVKIFISFRNVV